jgi:hypothetical protein
MRQPGRTSSVWRRIVRNVNIIYARGCGHADLEHKEPVTNHTIPLGIEFKDTHGFAA